MKKYIKLAVLLTLLWAGPFTFEAGAAEDRPNFLIVVADDMGWSDIAALGGEIKTPTLDALARGGTVMTDYYVAPTCAPTRSMLITGVDNHQAGLGVQSGLRADNQVGINYEGQLHNGVVTIAEALSAIGYQTSMSGKWHLAHDMDQAPVNRGFQKSFALMPTGGASHFADQLPISPHEPAHYIEDHQRVDELPDDWYSSIGYADKLLQFLGEREQDAPFFAYLAFTAPHDPLQVPDEWLDRYNGVYDAGPVAMREARAQRQMALGLLPQGTQLWDYPRFPEHFPNHAAPWTKRSKEQREKAVKPMEIYAAMVELMDQQIGRVLRVLEAQGDLDNTYVIFFSDNGAASYGPLVYPGSSKKWLAQTWDNTFVDPGKPRSFTTLGREWASAAVTPWSFFKNTVSEGGIRSPLIVSGPNVVPGKFNNALAHVTDIAPTIYELAGVNPADNPLFENKVQPQGFSLMPVLNGQVKSVRSSFGVHLFGNTGYRRGQMKISKTNPPIGSGKWQLFDLEEDPGEVNDLAEQQPETMEEMLAGFNEYLRLNAVILTDESPLKAGPRRLHSGECDWWCEARFMIMGLRK
ncbi:MAG: arylsulfatase [Pseudomonadota bacterium]